MPEHPGSALDVTVWGDGGETAVLLHGSMTPDLTLVWQHQKQLAESGRYRLLVPSRRGYGHSPTPAPDDWDTQVEDVVGLLGEGAHLVGFSYGAVLALVAAGRYPGKIRSLCALEPPAFHLARGNPAADKLRLALDPIFKSRPALPPAEFKQRFGNALHPEAPAELETLSGSDEQAVLATMREPVPWEAPIDPAALAATTFSGAVVTGGWHPAFEAVGDVLASIMGVPRTTLTGSGHGAMHMQEPFNTLLLDLWARPTGTKRNP